MTHTTSRVSLVLGLVVAVASGVSLAGRTEQAPPAPDVLPALLTEVRGLRAAIEQMAAAGPRVQLALGRVQLQEQRITTLVRRLDDVRVRLAKSRGEFAPADRQLKELEGSPRQDPDPEVQQMRAYEIKERKYQLTQIGDEVRRLTDEETYLMQEISAEQARWTDFNQRLEALERTLGGR